MNGKKARAIRKALKIEKPTPLYQEHGLPASNPAMNLNRRAKRAVQRLKLPVRDILRSGQSDPR